MLKLGITGGIGSGKSTISQLLELFGIPVYCADVESKKLTAASPVIKSKLIDVFGEKIYEGGVLNKPLLASYIFNDDEKLRLVNNIIHPEVAKHFEEWLDAHSAYPVVGHEAAILFESGLNILLDKIVLVYAPPEVRIERVMQRDGVAKQKVIERMNNQMPDEEKIKLSDFVIKNDGTISLISQVENMLKEFNYNL